MGYIQTSVCAKQYPFPYASYRPTLSFCIPDTSKSTAWAFDPKGKPCSHFDDSLRLTFYLAPEPRKEIVAPSAVEVYG